MGTNTESSVGRTIEAGNPDQTRLKNEIMEHIRRFSRNLRTNPERFITYMVNAIDDTRLKEGRVFITGNPANLGHNLINTLRNTFSGIEEAKSPNSGDTPEGET
jgi:hypothetical protein